MEVEKEALIGFVAMQIQSTYGVGFDKIRPDGTIIEDNHEELTQNLEPKIERELALVTDKEDKEC